MKAGKTLVDLATELQGQSEAKKDFIAETRVLEIASAGKLTLQNGTRHEFPVTEHPTNLEQSYLPNMKLIQQGEQDRLKQMPARFPAVSDYMRGYKAPCAHYLTVIQDDTAERSHFLITLIHKKTGEEKLVDLLTDASGFSTIRNILNCHDYQAWGVFEVLDFDCPF